MDILFGYGVAFVFGLVIGVVIFWFYSMGSGSGQAAEELENLKQEHTTYRSKVDNHFLETAELFKDLTDRYREVYKHMAAGADSLCSEDVKKLQAELSSTNLLIDAGDAKPVEVEAEEVTASPEAKKSSEKVVESAPKPETKPESTAKPSTDKAESDTPKEAVAPKDHVPEPAAAKESEDKKPKKSAESSKSDDEDADGVPLASEVEVHPDLRAATQKPAAEGAKLH